jgi:hypothetical protein
VVFAGRKPEIRFTIREGLFSGLSHRIGRTPKKRSILCRSECITAKSIHQPRGSFHKLPLVASAECRSQFLFKIELFERAIAKLFHLRVPVGRELYFFAGVISAGQGLSLFSALVATYKNCSLTRLHDRNSYNLF